ncbi:hypothetical protein KFU94_25525 [Chloroflexi bacterium TSY]|nr:hypothetical protein [Chloroflexi bacterium TSY]
MNTLSQVTFGIIGGLIVLVGIGWVGLQVQPSNLLPPPDEPGNLGTVAVPPHLPAPVRRYFEVTLGEEVPRVGSLVVCGRARANFGIWMSLRYRLVHRPGYAFERYMEVTWFGFPVLKAIDRYVDGIGMTGPMGKEATGPAVDQGANMILWVEAPLMPSLWITDPRIRWEAIDETAARLIFPFDDEEDELIVYFDPESSLITRITALRYRDEASGKIPWRADFLAWQKNDGITLPSHISITWEDQGKPWSYWKLEDYFWNVDISELLADSHLDGTTDEAAIVADE